MRHLVFALAFATVATVSFGQSFNFAQRLERINAGVLMLDTQLVNGGTPQAAQANLAPYVFWNLDSAPGIKPAGWQFVNPSAPSSTSSTVPAPDGTPQTVAQRWSNITGGGIAPGQRITKNLAPYWEVFLRNSTVQQLSQYDILLVPAYGTNINFNAAERDSLRAYIDGGGILWVDFISDGAGSALDPANGLPVPFALDRGNRALNPATDLFQPIFSFPYQLSRNDIRDMEWNPQATTNLAGVRQLVPADLGGVQALLLPLFTGFDTFITAAADGNLTSVGFARIGDGFLVVTTRGVARTANRVVAADGSYVPNLGFSSFYASAPRTDFSWNASARFIVNALNLGTGSPTPGGGSRRTSAQPIDIGAPLLKRYSVTNEDLQNLLGIAEPNIGGSAGPNSSHPPALYKGLLVVTSNVGSTGRVFVFDATPGRDLDGDGNPDDGIPDFNTGASYDLVWVSEQINASLSPPTVTEVPGTNNEVILFTDSQGRLHGYDLLQLDANGFIRRDLDGSIAANRLFPAVSPPSGGASVAVTPDPGPYAPAVHEGTVFIADAVTSGGVPRGRVWQFDLVARETIGSPDPWYLGAETAQQINLDAPSFTPTVGYIPVADESGAQDRVLYLPTRPVSGVRQSPGIYSIWVGTKGERPPQISRNAGNLRIVLRAAQAGGSGSPLPVFLPPGSPFAPASRYGVRISALDRENGDPLSVSELQAFFQNGATITQPSPGIIEIPLSNPAALPDIAIRVDYTLDWGGLPPAARGSFIRGSLYLPNEGVPGPDRRILQQIALAPNGNMFVTSSSQRPPTIPQFGDPSTVEARQPGGGLFCLQEVGRGSFVLRYRWEFYPQYEVNLSQGGTATYEETLRDYDTLNQLIPFFRQRLTQFTMMSAPSVVGDTVFVTASAIKSPGIPVAILLAFQANPQPRTIFVDGGVTGNFAILQPDMARSTNKTRPDQFNTLQANQREFQAGTGGSPGIIRINNMMSSFRDQMLNGFSASQPVILRVPGRPDTVIEPDANGSNWSPLLWFTTFNGLRLANYGQTFPTGSSPAQVYYTGAPAITGNTIFMTGASTLAALLEGTNFFQTRGSVLGLDVEQSTTSQYVRTLSPNNNPGIPGGANFNRPWLNQITALRLDADPTASVPFQFNLIREVNPSFRWPQIRGILDAEDFVVRNRQTTLGSSVGANGVVAGDGSIVAWTNSGVFGFDRADFSVIDQGRVARFDPAGNPLWQLDAGFTSGPTGASAAARQVNLVEPTRIYPVTASEQVIVDTGGNRVVRVNNAGFETRSINQFMMDPVFVPSGWGYYQGQVSPDGFGASPPTRLKMPRDVQIYTSFVEAARNPFAPATRQPLEYWVHYLIADSGNFRMIEVVDRYAADPVTRRIGDPVVYQNYVMPNGSVQNVPAFGVLLWHSPSNLSGNRYVYTGVSRLETSGPGGTRRIVYAAGFANQMPTIADTGGGLGAIPGDAQRTSVSGNGGVVIFDGPDTVVINSVVVPAITGELWNDEDLQWQPANLPQSVKGLNNLFSVTMRNIFDETLGTRVAIMFTDGTGVYEIWQPDTDANAPWVVRWMLPSAAYLNMRRSNFDGIQDRPNTDNPLNFVPVYARRLDDGDVIITNAYVGQNRLIQLSNGNIIGGQRFGGEIIQIDGEIGSTEQIPTSYDLTRRNLGFNTRSIKFTLPPITGSRQISAPLFGDRR